MHPAQALRENFRLTGFAGKRKVCFAMSTNRKQNAATTTVRIPVAIVKRIDSLAAREKRSTAKQVEFMLQQALDSALSAHKES